MQVNYVKTALSASKEGIERVTSLAWSPNNQRLAVVKSDRIIHLFNERGEKKEKFSTKPAVRGGPKNYIVRTLCFSPDSTKLAVAQSDNIVYIYKLGLEWGTKITICNKFTQSSPVTCLAWASKHQNEVVFGLADGKIKLGQLKTNSSSTLYSTSSYVVSICVGLQGRTILTGHLDGSIYRYDLAGAGGGSPYTKFAHFACPPTALGWGAAVVAAGSDRKVCFYDNNGAEIRHLDYSNDDDVKEFTVAAFNPSGQSVVLGNYDKFFVFAFNATSQSWESCGPHKVENYYTITALAWRGDGARLTVGTLCGCVDIYDASAKRVRYNGKFLFTYISPSQVIVKRIGTGERTIVKSLFDHQIVDINIYCNDQFLIAKTTETILCGDLQTCKISEVPWVATGKEKYVFDNPNICMIYSSGELSLVEYGKNEILANCTTEHMRSTLVSVRINERPPRASLASNPFASEYISTGGAVRVVGVESKQPGEFDNRKIAYLLDKMTIRIMDLGTGYTEATVNHDAKIDWLELNARADLLLYRDKRRRLHLYNVNKQAKTTLLSFCEYVQWVPMSDVVVAQNRENLCVWYNIEAPEKMTNIPITGSVEEIERIDGKTEVRVDDGLNSMVYCLDEALIGFGSALEDGQLERAMQVLESQSKDLVPGQVDPANEAMWRQLSEVAMEQNKLNIAERCFAAVGDLPKARYLRKVNKAVLKENRSGESNSHWLVSARLAHLKGNLNDAESIYLEHGQTDEAIIMYQNMHKWDEAIRVAEERGDPEAAQMKLDYFDYLLTSGQQEKAGFIRETEGNYDEAIDLYLRGGRPAKAMNVVTTYKRNYSSDVLERIASALTRSKMYGKAGEFYERMNQNQRALESYIKGQSYGNAVKLARVNFPEEVVRLEEAWGDWLVQNKSMEAAIKHYIQAGSSKKAIEATLATRHWEKAGQLVDSLQSSDEELARSFYRRIARHYSLAQQFKQAEKYFALAKCEKDAIQMYTESGQWKAAHKLATRCMSSAEVTSLYKQQATVLQGKGKWREAERLLLTVNALDDAIEMYRSNRKFDHMLRLIATHRKESLNEAVHQLAKELEMQGKLKEAEEYYVRGKDWQAAVDMYIANKAWDQAMSVAKANGGMKACTKVAYTWAGELGGEEGAKLLIELDLVEQAIDHATESGLFDEAIEIAKNSMPSQLPEVYLRYGQRLEQEDQYEEAETQFIQAGKPSEAIAMYQHQQDWSNAMRVADKYDPHAILDILQAQGEVAVEKGQYEAAEQLFLNAKKPNLVLDMYKKLGRWTDAIKFAKKHLPQKLQDVKNAYELSRASAASQNAVRIESQVERSSAESKKEARAKQVQKSRSPENARTDASIRSIYEEGKVWEDSREYARAMETFLEARMRHLEGSSTPNEDVALLEKSWLSAVRIASKHVQNRYEDVALEAAHRLKELGRNGLAGDLFKEIDVTKEAVQCYVTAGKFEKARELCQGDPILRNMVDEAHRRQLKKEKNSSELAQMGDFDAAISVYLEKGDWEKVFETVESKCPQLGGKYAVNFAKAILKDKDIGGVEHPYIDKALSELARYGLPKGNKPFSLICRLSQELLSRDKVGIEGDDPEKGVEEYTSSLRCLREIIFDVVQNSGRKRQHEGKSSENNYDTLDRLLIVVHLYLYMYVCEEKEIPELACQIAVSLLRFAGDIPADKIFYIAGDYCLRLEWDDKAFVLLNRYIDLVDAICEQDIGQLDNQTFANTDIPMDHALPKWQYIDEDSQQETREWVIESAPEMNDQEDLDLPAWFESARKEVCEQLPRIVKRHDKGALTIEEHLRGVRQQYGLE